VRSPTDYTIHIDQTLKRHHWDHYHEVRKISQIPMNEIADFDLQNRLLQQVYSPLFRVNNGPHWSSILTCQAMTRLSVQFFGYQFPDDIQLTTNILPMMLDFYFM
jgi:hypothetical protein